MAFELKDLVEPKFWCKFVGVVELIAQIILTVLSAFDLVSSWKNRKVNDGSEANTREIFHYYELEFSFYSGVVVTLLVTSGLGVIMAVVLLKGAFKRDYNRLNYWLVYAIMATGAIFLILLIVGGHVWSVVIRSFIFLVIRGAMVWCVYVDLKDLEGETQNEDKVRLSHQHQREQNVDTTAI